MGWMSAVCDAHKKEVDVEQLYNSVHRKFNQLKFRSVGEKMLEWGTCPREAGSPDPRLSSPGERERNAVMAIRVGSISCSSVRSPTPSHSKTFCNPFEPFQIKREVYFSKELCRSSLLCRCYDSACICVSIVGHGYTTRSLSTGPIQQYFCAVVSEVFFALRPIGVRADIRYTTQIFRAGTLPSDVI